jgi:hypothetical protein
MEEAVDEGVLIKASGEALAVPVLQQLTDRVIEIGAPCLQECLDPFADGGADDAHQDEDKNDPNRDVQDLGAKHRRPPISN